MTEPSSSAEWSWTLESSLLGQLAWLAMNSPAPVSSSSPVGGNGAAQRKGPRGHSLLEDATCHRNISLVLRTLLGAQRDQWNEDICEGLELNMGKLSECLDKGVAQGLAAAGQD